MVCTLLYPIRSHVPVFVQFNLYSWLNTNTSVVVCTLCDNKINNNEYKRKGKLELNKGTLNIVTCCFVDGSRYLFQSQHQKCFWCKCMYLLVTELLGCEQSLFSWKSVGRNTKRVRVSCKQRFHKLWIVLLFWFILCSPWYLRLATSHITLAHSQLLTCVAFFFVDFRSKRRLLGSLHFNLAQNC